MRLWAYILVMAVAAAASPAADPVAAFRKAWEAAGADTAGQTAAVEALATSGVPEAVEPLAVVASEVTVDVDVAEAAHLALAGMATDAAIARIGDLAHKDRRDSIRMACARALASSVHPARAGHLIALVSDAEWRVRSWALRGLGGVRTVEAVDALVGRIGREDGRLAAEAAESLRRLTGQDIAAAADWRTWWAAHREGFAFPDPVQEAAEVHVGLGRTRERGAGGVFETVASKRVVFVVDTSGSMQVRSDPAEGQPGTGPSRLDHVKLDLTPLLKEALPPGSRFNVVAFGTEVIAWKPGLVEVSASNRASAARFVAALLPDGETNIIGALEAALADKDVDTVYFLSDGFPTAGRTIDTGEILKEVRRLNRGRGAAIHAIAFIAGDGLAQGIVESKDVCTHFLRELARIGHGRLRVVE